MEINEIKKYCNIDNDNKILGFYSTDIYSDIPNTAIEITEELWLKALEISANYYDGNNVYYKDNKTLDELKEIKIYEFNQRKIKVQENGTYFEGKLVKGRQLDIIGILAVVSKLANGLASTWCYSSGEREEITTIERAKELATVINSINEGSLVKCSILEEKIKNATTIEELDLIVWGD